MGQTSTTVGLNQGELFAEVVGQGREARDCAQRGTNERRVFVEPNPDSIFIGARRLRAYLEGCGELGALRLEEALRSVNWREFEAAYDGPGRPPYAPRLMTGLLMYGILKGVNSLRGLESLSRTDLGCMAVCGGIQPDHSSIGRFLLRHEGVFEEGFFEQVTRLALRATGSGVEEAAGDGTVLQAAGSRYRTLKREALERKLAAAKRDVETKPEDKEAVARRDRYAAAEISLKGREDKKAAKGKPTAALRVCTTEPDAVIQPLKNKSYAPSYKPSVLANNARVIIGKAVDPSDESAVVGQMLDEAERIGGTQVRRLMVDGNYCNEVVINDSLNREIDLLCPEHGETPREAEKIRKSDFHYDEQRDVYVCPMGNELEPRSRAKDGSYVQYERHGCGGCPLRPRCFSRKSTRRVVRRLPVDEAKEALRQVMEDPRAKLAYTYRKAMVEPVFAFISGIMNLRRFRRRGLKRVQLEFSVYASAYNLGRVLAAVSGTRRTLDLIFGVFLQLSLTGRRSTLARPPFIIQLAA